MHIIYCDWIQVVYFNLWIYNVIYLHSKSIKFNSRNNQFAHLQSDMLANVISSESTIASDVIFVTASHWSNSVMRIQLNTTFHESRDLSSIDKSRNSASIVIYRKTSYVERHIADVETNLQTIVVPANQFFTILLTKLIDFIHTYNLLNFPRVQCNDDKLLVHSDKFMFF